MIVLARSAVSRDPGSIITIRLVAASTLSTIVGPRIAFHIKSRSAIMCGLCDPDFLGRHVDLAIRKVCSEVGAIPKFGNAQMFRPGRPQPTHRIIAAAAR
jgi:hypothetical protein